MKKYQQGDVLIIEIENDDEWKKASESQYRKTHIKRNGDDGNVVLAFGEVTGHSHQFKPEEMLNDGSDKLLIDTNIFDVYSGKELDNNSKSLAISLYFRSDEKTLIDKDVDDRVSVIINILKEKFNIIQR